MQEFIDVLDPYLSNQRLYDFVDKLCRAELKLENAATAKRKDANFNNW